MPLVRIRESEICGSSTAILQFVLGGVVLAAGADVAERFSWIKMVDIKSATFFKESFSFIPRG